MNSQYPNRSYADADANLVGAKAAVTQYPNRSYADANLVGAKAAVAAQGLSVSLNERIDNLEKGLSALHEELNRVEMAVDRLLGADKRLTPPPVSESPKLDCFADRLTELAARMASLYGRVARLGNRLNAAV